MRRTKWRLARVCHRSVIATGRRDQTTHRSLSIHSISLSHSFGIGAFPRALVSNTAGIISTDNIVPLLVGAGLSLAARSFDEEVQLTIADKATGVGDTGDAVGDRYIVTGGIVGLFALARSDALPVASIHVVRGNLHATRVFRYSLMVSTNKPFCLLCGLVAIAVPSAAQTQTPRATLESGKVQSLKDHLNVELGVDLFGLGVSRSVWRTSDLDPAVTLRGIASTRGGFLVESAAEKRLGNSALSAAVFVSASTLERNRFYGFGNGTDANQHGGFYQLEQLRFEAGAALTLALPGEDNGVTFGPLFQHLWTENDAGHGQFDDAPDEIDDGGVMRFLSPYGGGSFQQLGFQTTVGLGTPGPRSGAATGLRLDLGVRAFPAWMDLKSPAAVTTADLNAFVVVPAPMNPAVYVRVSVDRVFGEAPFHESAFLGGRRSLRGFQKQRFAGDLAVSVNSELRLNGWRFRVAGRDVQGGPTAIFDMGRVYLHGVSNGGWHVGAGGGFWLREERSGRTVSAALVRSAEGMRTYVALGFPFWR